MRAVDLVALLRARPAHLRVFLKGAPVTGVSTLRGRIRRAVMGDNFDEMPDKARDNVLTLTTAADNTGTAPVALKVKDLIRLLESQDMALEMFVDGCPIDGVDVQHGKISDGYFTPLKARGRDAILTFTRWTEFSDGNQYLVPFDVAAGEHRSSPQPA